MTQFARENYGAGIPVVKVQGFRQLAMLQRFVFCVFFPLAISLLDDGGKNDDDDGGGGGGDDDGE